MFKYQEGKAKKSRDFTLISALETVHLGSNAPAGPIYAMNNAMHAYKTYHHGLEIFSGSLLNKRKEWQQMKSQLPAHTYLLVTPLTNSAPTRFMLNLGRTLRDEGISVFVLSVG